MLDHCKLELDLLTKNRDDLLFAIQLAEHDRTGLVEVYNAAVLDNEIKTLEIQKLRNELQFVLEQTKYKIDPDLLLQ